MTEERIRKVAEAIQAALGGCCRDSCCETESKDAAAGAEGASRESCCGPQSGGRPLKIVASRGEGRGCVCICIDTKGGTL